MAYQNLYPDSYIREDADKKVEKANQQLVKLFFILTVGYRIVRSHSHFMK
jgi:hypothetical protein